MNAAQNTPWALRFTHAVFYTMVPSFRVVSHIYALLSIIQPENGLKDAKLKHILSSPDRSGAPSHADRAYFVRAIGDICESAIADFKLNPSLSRKRDIDIIDGYVGRGYALSQPAELALLCEVARTEGIIFDPVYTAKAFFGMVQELKQDPGRFGKRIVFIHTGGIFGLFPKANEIECLL